MSNSVKEFSVNSGSFVYAISADGKKYGQDGRYDGTTKKIRLAPGEKITKVKYGLLAIPSPAWKDFRFMCQLMFYSNKNKKYGPYGRANPFGIYHEVNNLQGDWTKLIEIDRHPVGFKGASSEAGEEFSVHYRQFIHCISLKGKKYGQNLFDERTEKIKLAPGEKITKVRYALAGSYFWSLDKHVLCQLMFYSNMNKIYGPYGNLDLGPFLMTYWEVNDLPYGWTKAIKMHGNRISIGLPRARCLGRSTPKDWRR